MRWTRLAILWCIACGDRARLEDAALATDSVVIDAAAPACANVRHGTRVSMRRIGSVTGGAMLATAPPNDPRLFVVEQRGAIRIFKHEALLPAPFLDLSNDAGGPIVSAGEQGLLGLGFHPQYATNGQFFVYYTTRLPGDALRDVVARCTASANPDRANPGCIEVLSIPDFAANHNGGMIELGPDGYLYIATGDGGGAGDPQQAAQDPSSLLGKMLRLDVDAKLPGKEYGIPASNPFAAGGGAPEVFMLGLRNPWRWSFDRATGDMWIGDVGQDETEELTVLAPAEQRGANLGWNTYEGHGCFAPPCSPAGMTFPQDTRRHADGWISIIGGQVYRGSCFPDLAGDYFYTDHGAGSTQGILVKARLQPDRTLTTQTQPGPFPASPASLHADGRGEFHLTTTTGGVYRLEAGP